MAGHLVRVMPHYAAIMQPDASGVCQHLRPDGDKWRCAIYETRPLICRTERMAAMKAAALGMPMEMYLAIVADGCEWLRQLVVRGNNHDSIPENRMA